MSQNTLLDKMSIAVMLGVSVLSILTTEQLQDGLCAVDIQIPYNETISYKQHCHNIEHVTPKRMIQRRITL